VDSSLLRNRRHRFRFFIY